MSHGLTATLLILASVAVCLSAYFYEKEIESMNEKKFIDPKKSLPARGHVVEIKRLGGLYELAYLDETKTERIPIWVLNQRSVYLGLPDVVGWRERE